MPLRYPVVGIPLMYPGGYPAHVPGWVKVVNSVFLRKTPEESDADRTPLETGLFLTVLSRNNR